MGIFECLEELSKGSWQILGFGISSLEMPPPGPCEIVYPLCVSIQQQVTSAYGTLHEDSAR